MEAAWGPKTAPNSTYSATVSAQALDPHMKPRLSGPSGREMGQVQKSLGWQAIPRAPTEQVLPSTPAQPRSSKPAEAKPQPNLNKYGKHTETATGQRSPEAPALYGCTKPHQARTTPRHRQETEAGRAKE